MLYTKQTWNVEIKKSDCLEMQGSKKQQSGMFLLFFFFPLFVWYIWVMEKPEMEIPVVQNNKTPWRKDFFSIKGTKKETRQNFFNNNCPKPAIQSRRKKTVPINRGWVGSLGSHFKRVKRISPSLLGDISQAESRISLLCGSNKATPGSVSGSHVRNTNKTHLLFSAKLVSVKA